MTAMNRRVPTLATAIQEEMARRGTIQARVAEEMGVERSKLNRWITDGAEPDGESLERLANFLGLKSIFDLGPFLVATKLERAHRRGRL
jgi:transcriptional regulator with XRE-family HTH domain